MGKYIDLAGQKFGKLTVIKRVEDHITPSGQHKQLWLCRCDCGNEKIIRGESLRNGSTMSCGCLKQSTGEMNIEEILKQNNISFVKEKTFPDFIYEDT